MTQLEMLLQNDPNVQQFALGVLRECPDMREFSARCLETMLNSAMSKVVPESRTIFRQFDPSQGQ